MTNHGLRLLLALLGLGGLLAVAAGQALGSAVAYSGEVGPPVRAAGAQDAASRQINGDRDLSQLEVEELIRLLPRYENESRWDKRKKAWVLVPVVAEFKRRLDEGTLLTDEQWRDALLQSRAIRVRDRWPVSLPFAISMRIPRWLGGAVMIFLDPKRDELRTAVSGSYAESGCWSYKSNMFLAGLHQELGNLPLGDFKLEFDVEVKRGSYELPTGSSEGSDVVLVPVALWEGLLGFDVQVVETVDEAIQPLSNPDVDQAVRNAIGIGIERVYADWKWHNIGTFELDLDSRNNPYLATLGLSLRLEIVVKGEVIDESDLVDSAYDHAAYLGSDGQLAYSIGSCQVCSIPEDVLKDDDLLADWELRVTGTSRQVWRLWEGRERWSGTITIPLREALDRARGWAKKK